MKRSKPRLFALAAFCTASCQAAITDIRAIEFEECYQPSYDAWKTPLGLAFESSEMLSFENDRFRLDIYDPEMSELYSFDVPASEACMVPCLECLFVRDWSSYPNVCKYGVEWIPEFDVAHPFRATYVRNVGGFGAAGTVLMKRNVELSPDRDKLLSLLPAEFSKGDTKTIQYEENLVPREDGVAWKLYLSRYGGPIVESELLTTMSPGGGEFSYSIPSDDETHMFYLAGVRESNGCGFGLFLSIFVPG